MTEIPEHLLKRAQALVRRRLSPPQKPRICRRRRRNGWRLADSSSPLGALEISEVTLRRRSRGIGGGVAVADRAAEAVAAAPVGGGVPVGWPGRPHPTLVDRREVGLDPRGEGNARRQGAHMAALACC